jgi:hypothetical protein
MSGRAEQFALAFHRGGDDADCAGLPCGDEVRALHRVDGDLHGVAVARAEFLADVEHRRLVAFSLADDHDALHVDVAERAAHRLARGLVYRVSVALANPTPRTERRRLSRAYKIHTQIAIHSHSHLVCSVCIDGEEFRRRRETSCRVF